MSNMNNITRLADYIGINIFQVGEENGEPRRFYTVPNFLEIQGPSGDKTIVLKGDIVAENIHSSHGLNDYLSNSPFAIELSIEDVNSLRYDKYHISYENKEEIIQIVSDAHSKVISKILDNIFSEVINGRS